MVADRQFWSRKRVFLTGHTGFKGTWLSLWLQSLGAEVTGFALAPEAGAMFAATSAAAGMSSMIGDIRDPTALAGAMRKADPEIVLHLAAQPIVRLSYDDPVATYMTNVMGTVHVLEAARTVARPRAILVVSSDKCYENPEWDWSCREHDSMGGHDPYSSSKGCTELVTSAYRRSYFGPQAQKVHGGALASARAGNVIGGGDWAQDRLIPDLARAAAAKTTAVIRNPAAVRPWQHVLEPLSGYLRLVERLWTDPKACAEGWNFGPADTDALPVGDIVTRFVADMGGRPAWTLDAPAGGPHEAKLLRLDSTKARVRLGWRPRWPIAQGIAMTAGWYKHHLDGADMRAVTDAQIAAYTAAA